MLEKTKVVWKKTWQVVNQCINKNIKISSLPKCFVANNVEIHDQLEITTGFNNFFVNIGPNLAKNLPECTDKSHKEYLKYEANYYVFLEPTCVNKVINIIKTFQGKDSYGHDGISINIVKKLSNIIALPFTYICNRSFECGVFPEKKWN